jgi:large subunit ribosomal protein L25
MLTLNVEKRDAKTSPENIRKTGKIPAVFYGPKEKSTPIVIDTKAFQKIWKQAGESTVVILKDGSDEHETLIHDTDVHPVSGDIRHADFYVIEKGKKVHVKISLVFTGISSAVKDKGGILVKVLREVEVEAAPRDLPRELSVDISKLVELTDVIHAGDIALPTGVTVTANDAKEVVASITVPKEEVVEPTAIDMAAIEVSDAKGKKPEEGAAAGAPAADGKDAKADKKGDKK